MAKYKRHARSKKKNKKTGSASTPTKNAKKWALEEKLSFLRIAEEHRGSFSNIEPPPEEEFDTHSIHADGQLSPTETFSMSTYSQMQTTLPTPSPTPVQQYSTTWKRKRSNFRENIAENL